MATAEYYKKMKTKASTAYHVLDIVLLETGANLSRVARKLGFSNEHARGVIMLLCEEGLLTAKTVGKEKQLDITMKGMQIHEALAIVFQHIKRII